jgi:two-component system, OmpR family, sensor histidine kinase BaeS
MKFPLWLRLFAAFSLLSVAGIGALTFAQKRSFQQDFLGYLNQQAMSRAKLAADNLGRRYEDVGNWGFVARRPRAFDDIVRGESSRGPVGSDSIERGGGSVGGPPPGPVPGRGPEGKGPPMKRITALDLTTRVALVDREDRHVIGNPAVPRDSAFIPVMASGVEVGRLLVAAQPALESDVDLAFARSQAQHAWTAALAVVLGALLAAWALARWLLGPIATLNAHTSRLAKGDYAARIKTARQDELGELAVSFNRLAETLAKNQDARRRWGADIAHELRTPLAILRGEIQALLDGVRPMNEAALQSLHAECEQLTRLVEDLYQLSVTDVGALEYQFETINLSTLVRDVADEYARQFATSELQLDVTRVADGVHVRGDARRLHQLLANVFTNADRYTDRPGRVEVSLTQQGKLATLRIDDSAPGVPDHALSQLFDRLYRVDASRSRLAGGAGLGLAICKQIAEAHQGSLSASHSALGGLSLSLSLATT